VLGRWRRCTSAAKFRRSRSITSSLKHSGELPIIGVNTFLSDEGSPTILPREVIRATEEEKAFQIAQVEALYDLVLFDVENTENRDILLTNIVQRKMVDGLIILSLKPTDSDLERFLQAGVPAVVVDARHPELSSIYVDNVQGGELATQHLINLGHKKIGYISDFPDNPFNLSPVYDRHQGYKIALKKAGISYRQEYYREASLNSQDARLKAVELLRLPDPPTAIFAYCDSQAIGVLEAARDVGLQVPQDLSVIGYDDVDAAQYLQLTTVRQCLFESGVKGAQLLLEVMGDVFYAPQEFLLPTELIIRGSTAVPSG
jgi:LacI family transcriptional regulator